MFRYDFKPVSIDEDKDGVLEVQQLIFLQFGNFYFHIVTNYNIKLYMLFMQLIFFQYSTFLGIFIHFIELSCVCCIAPLKGYNAVLNKADKVICISQWYKSLNLQKWWNRDNIIEKTLYINDRAGKLEDLQSVWKHWPKTRKN